MTALEADLGRAVATIVQTAKDLRSEDSQLHIELGTVRESVRIERDITRELVAAVDRRMDEFEQASERRHRELLTAIGKLGASVG